MQHGRRGEGSTNLICRLKSEDKTAADRMNQRGIKWQNEQTKKRERLLEGRTEIGAPTQSGSDTNWHLREATAEFWGPEPNTWTSWLLIWAQNVHSLISFKDINVSFLHFHIAGRGTLNIFIDIYGRVHSRRAHFWQWFSAGKREEVTSPKGQHVSNMRPKSRS